MENFSDLPSESNLPDFKIEIHEVCGSQQPVNVEVPIDEPMSEAGSAHLPDDPDDPVVLPTWLSSAVWKYFGFPKSMNVTEETHKFKKQDLKFTACSLCKRRVNYKFGSTTNMFQHLRSIHGIVPNKIGNTATFLASNSNSVKSSSHKVTKAKKLLASATARKYALPVPKATTDERRCCTCKGFLKDTKNVSNVVSRHTVSIS